MHLLRPLTRLQPSAHPPEEEQGQQHLKQQHPALLSSQGAAAKQEQLRTSHCLVPQWELDLNSAARWGNQPEILQLIQLP